MSEVVGGKRDLIAHDLANGSHILRQDPDSLIRNLDPGKGVHHVAGVEHAGGGRYGSRDRLAQLDADIHLEEGETHLGSGLETLPHFYGIGCGGCVAVAADPIAELPASQLVGRHAVGLAGEVHQGHLDGADAASLSGVAAELLDAPEDPVDVARVCPEDAALEHERIDVVGPIADLAQAVDVLVGVDADERGPEGESGEVDDPQVGDPEVRGAGVGIDVICDHFGFSLKALTPSRWRETG